MKKRLLLTVGTILQSRYRIVRQLGSGGMGAVYEAVDERINKTVAVKETFAGDAALRKAFEREARLLAGIEHRAFPQVTDYFSDGAGDYLVMDLVRGDDISEVLAARTEPIEPEKVCAWADEILDALETLHAQNIIHRDIKPSNLKLTPDGRIKLLDFGIAKGGIEDTTAGTLSSMAAATLQFAPLEQVLRASLDWYAALSVGYPEKTATILQKGTDAGSDLYALGATMYQLLTGQLPVNAPTRALALWSGQADNLLPVHEINPEISPAISAVLQKAMELDREKRPATAAEMRQMLSKTKIKKDETEKIEFVSPVPDAALPQSQIETLARVLNKTENKFPAGSAELESAVPVQKFFAPPESQEKTSVKSSVSSWIWIVTGLLGLILMGIVIAAIMRGDSTKVTNNNVGLTNNKSSGSSINADTLTSANTGNTNTTGAGNIGNTNSTKPTDLTSGEKAGDTSKIALPNGAELEMVYIVPGKFKRRDQEISINKSFYIGRFEVTQAQWQAVMGANPSYFKNCPQCPVDSVSWNNAKEFIRKLNSINKEYEFRLPSENEWEYAARAGAATEYAFGDTMNSTQANYDPKGNGGEYKAKTVPVGSYQPNAWGIYDVHGNVTEWAEDFCVDTKNRSIDETPAMSDGAKDKCRMGCSWFSPLSFCYLGSPNGCSYPTQRGGRDEGVRLAATLK